MPLTVAGQTLGSEPQLRDGTMWVPLRPVGEALGGSMDWNGDNNSAIMSINGHTISVQAGNPDVDVDGTTTTLQAAPYVADGETWVPVRFWNDVLGYGLNVDLGSSSVELVNPS